MEIRVFNTEEFSKIIYRDYHNPTLNSFGDLDKKIKYFSYDNLNTTFADKNYINTARFIVAYDDKEIYGVLLAAEYQLNKGYWSMSYISVNKEYKNLGISKKLITKFVEYYKDNFSNLTLSTSQYSVEGWLYMRPHLLKEIERLDVPFKDNIIGYGYDHPLFTKLREQSQKEVKVYDI